MRKILFILFFGVSCALWAQESPTCADIQPFCAGDSSTLTFENSHPGNSSQNTAENGPNYGCLFEQPYPAWFFMEIDSSGDLSFELSQSSGPNGTGTLLDVDYVVWGPFANTNNLCDYSASLNASNIVSCSYSEDAVEPFSINNALAGEVYVVVITNFSQQRGFISLEQVNTGAVGSGATDCSILEAVLGSDVNTCTSDPVILDATTTDAGSYYWEVDTGSGFQIIAGETNPTLSVNQTGEYRVTITATDGDQDSDSIDVTYINPPQAIQPQDLSACDQGDGTAYFNLESQSNIILGTQSDNLYTVTYYDDLASAENEQDALTNLSNYLSQSTTLYARVDYFEETRETCVAITNFDLFVNSSALLTNPFLNNEETILCVDQDGNAQSGGVAIGEDLGSQYIYNWTPQNDPDGDGIEEPIFQITQPGQYSLTITDMNSGCTSPQYTTNVVPSAPPELVSVVVETEAFTKTNLNTISVITSGNSKDYEYSLDNASGPYQSDSVFTQVGPGSHVVYVRDLNRCGITASEVFNIIDYPVYFTPNGDGVHDTWNITSLNTDLNRNARIFIFDRFGKLLKQLSPVEVGWDGTFNGTPLSSGGYWFRVEYLEPRDETPRVFKSHFALKR